MDKQAMIAIAQNSESTVFVEQNITDMENILLKAASKISQMSIVTLNSSRKYLKKTLKKSKIIQANTSKKVQILAQKLTQTIIYRQSPVKSPDIKTSQQ